MQLGRAADGAPPWALCAALGPPVAVGGGQPPGVHQGCQAETSETDIAVGCNLMHCQRAPRASGAANAAPPRAQSYADSG
eukprot:10465696-Alexandrium_andersonii.AAC.1